MSYQIYHLQRHTHYFQSDEDSCNLFLFPSPFLLSHQWLDYMTAPLQRIIDNTEELEPTDGIGAFEIPPLGGAENLQEVRVILDLRF